MRRRIDHIPFVSKSLISTHPIYQRPSKNKIPAILISRHAGGIGDMLMITPSIKAIKEANPDIPIIVSTSSAYGGGRAVLFDILKHNPYIDKVISIDKLVDYDFKKVYNFGSGQEIGIEVATNKHRIDIFAELAGVELKDKQTIYIIKDNEIEWAKKWIDNNIPSDRRKLIAIQVQTMSPRRNWPEEKTRLTAFLTVSTWPTTSVILFYDGITEIKFKKYPNIYPIAGMPIRHVAALMNECEVFVGPDSGLLHLAGALKKKIVGLFGSIHPKSRLAYYPNARAVYHYYPCSPCWYSICTNRYNCMSDISVNSVLDRMGECLGTKRKDTKSILVIRMGGIGDLVMLTSALKQLKKDNPQKDIYLATLPKHISLLQGVSYLKDVIPIPDMFRHRTYGQVFDLRYAVEPSQIGTGRLPWELYIGKNRVDLFESLLGVESKEKDFEVFVDEKAKIKMKGLTEKLGKFVALQGVITSTFRTIPPEYIDPLCRLIVKKLKMPVVLFGQTYGLWWCLGNEDCPDIRIVTEKRVLNLLDKLDLQEMVALISMAEVVVGPDSGVVHLAGALKKKCVAIFGNIDPSTRTLHYPTVKALYPEGKLDCMPCWDITWVNGKGFTCKHLPRVAKSGPIAGAECMKLTTPQKIVRAIEEIL